MFFIIKYPESFLFLINNKNTTFLNNKNDSVEVIKINSPRKYNEHPRLIDYLS